MVLLTLDKATSYIQVAIAISYCARFLLDIWQQRSTQVCLDFMLTNFEFNSNCYGLLISMWYNTNVALYTCGFGNIDSSWWNANVISSYLVWLALLMCIVEDIDDLLQQSASTSNLDIMNMVHSKPTVKMKRKKKLRKKRIRTWFGRRKKRLARKRSLYAQLN